MGRLKAEIIANEAEIAAAWAKVAGRSIAGGSQTEAWCRLWRRHVDADCVLALLRDESGPVLILPLAIHRHGPVRVAALPGGKHANCNFPALLPDATVATEDLQALLAALHRARPDIDALLVERQLPELHGVSNPLLRLNVRPNPNVSLAISLQGGFDALLQRSSGKKKRKNHRNSQHHFTAAGGHRLVVADTAQEAREMVGSYLAFKQEQFARAGISNTYAPAGVRDFFEELFAAGAGQTPPRYEVKALQVGGKYRAVMGKSFSNDTVFIDFIGLAQDELSSASPGAFLFFEDIKSSCEAGLAIYSFGVGDEPYKRSWADLLTPTYDTNIGLTAKGRLYVVWRNLRADLIRGIKTNDALWPRVKRLRALLSRR
jgi:CelD/BcsL family acetyltransferase involved in cellulose biosynthesis